MADDNIVVGISDSTNEAETSLGELPRVGLDRRELSDSGVEIHLEEHVLGYYNVVDRLNSWGKRGVFGGKVSLYVICILLAFSVPMDAMAAELPVNLGSAGNFTVLANTTVTNVPGAGTTITGDVGVSPGAAVTGFPPGVIIGTIHAADPTAALAQADLTIAYNDAAGRMTAPVTVAGNIGGMTLNPGLYKSTSTLAISSGNLTLDALGDPNAVFIIQMASTLTVTSGLQVILAGNAQASNIFWQVGSSATLGSNSIFKGTILAQVSITLTTGAVLEGRALARTGAVTLDSNTLVNPGAPFPGGAECVAAANLEISCMGWTGTTGPLGETFHFQLHNGPSTATQCAAVACPTETLLVDAVIDCASFSPLLSCASNEAILAQLIGQAIDDQASTLFTWSITTGPSGLYIQSSLDFHCCVCGRDIGYLCEGPNPVGFPLDLCPLYNLCDGIIGNETTTLFTSGFGLQCVPAACPDIPTPTPTASPSVTSTVTSTPTPSSTGSLVPTNTVTSTPTPSSTGSVGPTNTPTSTPTPSSTETPDLTQAATPTASPLAPGQDCDSGYYILDSLGGRHRVGNPILIAGPVYFGTDVARDMERAVCDLATSGTEDLVVLDAFGAAHFVANPVCEIPQDFYFSGETFRAIDLAISTDSQGLWVLTDNGSIWRAGTTKDPGDPALLSGTDLGVLGTDIPLPERDPNLNPGGVTLRAVSLVVVDENRDSRAEGYIVLDSSGGRFHFNADGSQVAPGSSSALSGNEPGRLLDPEGYVWPFFPGLDIARDMELHSMQGGVVVLDGWGGIHPVPVDIESNPVFFANNAVSASDPSPKQAVGMPYIVVGFDDPLTQRDESEVLDVDGSSIFTDLEFAVGCPDSGLYTLDKFGGVFVMGSARPDESQPVPDFFGSPYFFPFQYARDMEVFGRDESQFEIMGLPE